MTTPSFIGAIAAMTQDHVIGRDGTLPWRYSEDLQRFKRRTLNSTIIMGRLTFESINKQPLPKRRNMVLTREAKGVGTTANGAELFSSLEAALAACGDSQCWIIGGGQIYQLAMPYLTTLDITYVPDLIDDPKATVFPDIDPAIWLAGDPTPIENTELVNIIYTRRNAVPGQNLGQIQ